MPPITTNILRYPANFRSGAGETKSGDGRYITFVAKEYLLRNKESVDNMYYDKHQLCAIALSQPNDFQENFSQNWNAESILSWATPARKITQKMQDMGLGMGVFGSLQRSFGRVINPSEEMLYQGPNFRTFSFQYDFLPTSSDELVVVKAILIAFKRYSLPCISQDNLFIQFPPVWTLTMSGFEELEFAQAITFGIVDRPMALTDITFNYTPEGAFYAFPDGSPVKVSINFTLSDLTPLYRNTFTAEDIGEEAIMKKIQDKYGSTLAGKAFKGIGNLAAGLGRLLQ